MFGDSPIERAKIQNIVENVKDIKEKWGKLSFGIGLNKEDKEKAISKWFNEEYITWLTKLETSLIYSTVDGYSVSGTYEYSYIFVHIHIYAHTFSYILLHAYIYIYTYMVI